MDSAKEIWSKAWPTEMHTDEYASKRILSAKAAKMTPVLVNKEDLFAYFQGNHGRYETFLDSCSCGDFRRSKRPCKHIYRFAMELGLIDSDFYTDSDKIPTPLSERLPLESVIDLVESLPENLQRRLLSISVDCDSGALESRVYMDEEIEELLKIGIIVQKPVSKRSRKACVALPQTITPRHVHFYLNRKYGCTSDFNEYTGEFIEVPLIKTKLPDDSITQQLIKRGYYFPS